MKKVFALVLIAAATSLGTARAQSSLFPRDTKEGASIDQKMGNQIPLDLEFRDETGKVVKLGDYFGDKPVILTPVYFTCPMLCNLVLDGLVKTSSDLKFDIGDQYEVVTVSFDERDTPEIAREKKDIYAKRYGRDGVENGWHFLTGDKLTIKRLTDSVGFHFQYDQALNQFAHPAAIIVLTPGGKVSRYYYGFEYSPRDLRLGLVEASNDTIGTPVDQALLLCYSYDPATGKYSAVAMNIIRLGGVLTILLIGGAVALMLRREKRARG